MAPCPQSNKQLEGGTLSQLHLINRRNAVTKVARDCHVLDTAMKHLGMTTVDSRLSFGQLTEKNTLDCKLLEPSSIVCIIVYI